MQGAQVEDSAQLPGSNNALFQDDNPFDFRQEMLRLDYQPTGAHRLTGRLVFDHYDLIEPGGDPFVGAWSLLLGRSALAQGRLTEATARPRP